MHAGYMSNGGRANIGTDEMAYSTCCPGQLRYVHPKVWRVIPVIFIGLGMTIAGLVGVVEDRKQLAELEKRKQEMYGSAQPPPDDSYGNGETWPYAVLGWGIFLFLGSIVYAYSLQRSSMDQGRATRGAINASMMVANAAVLPAPTPQVKKAPSHLAPPDPTIQQAVPTHQAVSSQATQPDTGGHSLHAQPEVALGKAGPHTSGSAEAGPAVLGVDSLVEHDGNESKLDSSLNRTSTNIILVQNNDTSPEYNIDDVNKDNFGRLISEKEESKNGLIESTQNSRNEIISQRKQESVGESYGKEKGKDSQA